MRDTFKRNSLVNYTAQDLNASCVKNKNRAKMVQKVHKQARLAIKRDLTKMAY